MILDGAVVLGQLLVVVGVDVDHVVLIAEDVGQLLVTAEALVERQAPGAPVAAPLNEDASILALGRGQAAEI
jgi:hypothetical protein